MQPFLDWCMLIVMRHDVRKHLAVVASHRIQHEAIENRSTVMHISFSKTLHLRAFRVIPS